MNGNENRIEVARNTFAVISMGATNSYSLMIEGDFRRSKHWGKNEPMGFTRKILRIPDYSKRLKEVQMSNLDAINVITKYDSPDTLFYIDPPYFCKRKRYSNDIDKTYHIRLSHLLNNVRGKVVLSGYDSSLYGDLYKGWKVDRFVGSTAGWTVGTENKAVKRVECVWRNYG